MNTAPVERNAAPLLYGLALEETQLSRDLAASVAARALVGAGEVLGAVQRKCLSDTVVLWRRLCRLSGWGKLELVTLDACFPNYPTWDEVRDDLTAAFRNADALDAAYHWYRAEITVRRLAAFHAWSYGNDLWIAFRLDSKDDPDEDKWHPDDYYAVSREAFHYAAVWLGPEAK